MPVPLNPMNYTLQNIDKNTEQRYSIIKAQKINYMLQKAAFVQ